MIHIRNLRDLSIIQNDPELYREVASYILYCRFEMLEDEDGKAISQGIWYLSFV